MLGTGSKDLWDAEEEALLRMCVFDRLTGDEALN